MSANVILQLTDPAAVAAAGSSAQGLTVAPCFLQAVTTALAIQAHWLMHPASTSGSGTSNDSSSSSSGGGGGAGSCRASTGSDSSSSSSALSAESAVSGASSGGGSTAVSSPYKSWLFRRSKAQDTDHTLNRDQQQKHEIMLPSHALLLECLGLQQGKVEELVDVVYREAARPISQRHIERHMGMCAMLSQQLRATLFGPPVATGQSRTFQVGVSDGCLP